MKRSKHKARPGLGSNTVLEGAQPGSPKAATAEVTTTAPKTSNNQQRRQQWKKRKHAKKQRTGVSSLVNGVPALERLQNGKAADGRVGAVVTQLGLALKAALPQTGVGMGSNWEALKSKIQAGGKRKRAPEETLPEGAPDAKRMPAQLSDVTGVTHVVAVDCEMVGVGPEGARSSLARVCVVNNAGNVLMDSFVRQKERVTDYRTRFSGVRPADLREDHAEPFEKVQRAAAALFEGRVLVGHAVENDLQALLLSHPRKMLRDTAHYPPLMRATAPGRKPRPQALRHLSRQHLGLTIQEGEHSPVDDARAALYLYHKHRVEWEKHVKLGTVHKLQPSYFGSRKQATADRAPGAQKSLAELAARDCMVDL